MSAAPVRVVGSGVAATLAAVALSENGRDIQLVPRPAGRRASFVMTAGPGFGAGLEALGLGDAWRAWSGRQTVRRHHALWGAGPTMAHLAGLRPDPEQTLVQRAALEGWLRDAAERRGVLIKSEAERDSAVFEVDATGRAATLALRHGAQRRRLAPLLAIAGKLAADQLVVGETAVQSTAKGWWYAARTAGSASLLYFTTPRAGADARAAAWAADLPQCGPLLGACDASALGTAFLASSSWLETPCGPNWAAVGDAALACDPLSAGGLDMAVESAILLRDCLGSRAFAAERYQQAMLSQVARYRIARQRAYRAGASLAQTSFWMAHARLS